MNRLACYLCDDSMDQFTGDGTPICEACRRAHDLEKAPLPVRVPMALPMGAPSKSYYLTMPDGPMSCPEPDDGYPPCPENCEFCAAGIPRHNAGKKRGCTADCPACKLERNHAGL